MESILKHQFLSLYKVAIYRLVEDSRDSWLCASLREYVAKLNAIFGVAQWSTVWWLSAIEFLAIWILDKEMGGGLGR